jgi:cytidine deaminase
MDGDRACRKGFVSHRTGSGIFFLKGSNNGCKAVYRVTFDGNIAIATGGTVEPISVALTINGEALGNATAIVTPAAIGDFFNVSITTFVDIPCGCCVTVSVENTSETTDIDITNANIIFDRVA